jgi:hypothetical protein
MVWGVWLLMAALLVASQVRDAWRQLIECQLQQWLRSLPHRRPLT